MKNENKTSNNVYGVNLSDEITPIIVRNAIITCFKEAHKEVLDEIKDFTKFESEEEFEKFKTLDVQILIKKIFKDLNEDYEHPNKESILKLVEELRDYACKFRNPEIVNKHTTEIMKLISKL